MKDKKIIIGWQEMISIPNWGISEVRAKIDTGARSSAFDVGFVEEINDNKVRFEVVYKRNSPEHRKIIESEISRHTRIRSSNGQIQHRYLVLVPVTIGPITKSVEFSLVCRKNMICRAIIGRKALEDDFIVDCSNKFLLNPRRKIKKSKGTRTK